MTKRLDSALVTENLGYKAVSLLIAVVLWVTILGRRDFVYTKTLDLQLQTGPDKTIVAQTADKVRVRVSGPRASLKKFMENSSSQTLTIDLSDREEGFQDIDIPMQKIEVPIGVKILSVRPNMIRAEVADVKKDQGK